MKTDYTHISVILDRSGSMEDIREDIIGSFNAFVRDQQGQPGMATLTLVQFDSQHPYEIIHRFAPLAFVSGLNRQTYVPRATTPLLDALGHGINDLEWAVSAMKEYERPAKVVFVVITDGQENASREFRREQIVKMIKEKTEQNKWQFVFLSADLGAIQDALSYGFQADAALLFKKNREGTASALAALSIKVADFRSHKKAKIGFDPGDRG